MNQFEIMSTITVPPRRSPMRSKSNCKHRRYLRIPEASIDPNAVIAYLKSHKLTKTLEAFLKQAARKQAHSIIDIVRQGAVKCPFSIQQLLEMVEEEAHTKHIAMSSSKYLTVQFQLHIWYCLTHSATLNKSRVLRLKEYITAKGSIISDIPQLLPYFALPYAQNPSQHPSLKVIFTPNWTNRLAELIQQCLGIGRDSLCQQEQWLIIIKDMIYICNQLSKQLPLGHKNRLQIERMIDRVKQYEQVLQRNNQKEDTNTKYKQLHQQLLQLSSKGPDTQFERSKLYHSLQLQLFDHNQQQRDKQLIQQLTAHDILLLGSYPHFKRTMFALEELKLMQMVSSYYLGRSYLASNVGSFELIPTLLVRMSKTGQPSKHDLQVINSCLQILQKSCIRPALFCCMLPHSQLLSSILDLFDKFYPLYDKGSPLVEHLFASNLALIMNITLHRSGRQLIVYTPVFQKLVQLLCTMKNIQSNQTIQSLTFSTVYLLLVQPVIVQRAERIRFKETLLDKMIERDSEYYVKIVQYMIKRLQGQECEEGTSDVDEQMQEEFDDTIEVVRPMMWVGGSLVGVDGDSHRYNTQLTHQHLAKGEDNVHSHSIKQPSIYSKNKYQWKLPQQCKRNLNI